MFRAIRLAEHRRRAAIPERRGSHIAMGKLAPTGRRREGDGAFAARAVWIIAHVSRHGASMQGAHIRLPQPLDLKFCKQVKQMRVAGRLASGRPESAGGPFLRGRNLDFVRLVMGNNIIGFYLFNNNQFPIGNFL